MRLPTASKLELAETCIGSAVLPSIARSSSVYAKRGTDIHKFVQTTRTKGREAALAEVEDDATRKLCEAIDPAAVLALDPKSVAGEVSFAFDCATGNAREIGRDTGRDYAQAGESEMVGTVDAVALTADGEGVFVGDLKTGHKRQTPAARNRQLQFGAVAAARAYGRKRATVALVYLREDGTTWVDQAEFDELDIDTAAAELKGLALRITKARDEVANGTVPPLHVGEHCKYCPAIVSCPAQAAMVKRMAAEPDAVVNDLRALLTPETAVRAYERAKAFREVLNLFDRALYAYARENPISLSNGSVLGEVTSTREYVEGAVAHEVLEEMFGRDVADRACELSSSKAAIQRVVGTKLKAALEAIRSRGGIGTKVTTTVKEHKPKAIGEAA